MLHLERLENRTLLSVTITDSQGLPNDANIDFAEGIGLTSAPEYVNILNNGPGVVNIDLDLNSTLFTIDPAFAAPFTIADGDTAQVPITFTPDAPGLVETPLIINTDTTPAKAKITLHGTGLSGDIALSNLALTNVTAEDNVVGPSAQIDVRVEVDSLGPVDLAASTVTFYLSTDDVLDGGDITLDTVATNALPVGTDQTINHTVTIPAGLRDDYKIIAAADPDDLIPAEPSETNNITASTLTLAVYPENLVVTDSVAPAGDQDIAFPNPIGVGDVSDPQYVYLENIGSDPVTIDGLDIPGGNFVTTIPANQQYPPGYDPAEAEVIDLNTSTVGFLNDPDGSVWYQFSADESHLVSIQTVLGSLHDSILTVYTDFGNQIAWNDDADGTGMGSLASFVSFAAPYTGDYYIEVTSFMGLFRGSYLLNTAVSSEPIHHMDFTPAGDHLTGQLRNGNFSIDSDWFSFTANYGDIVEFNARLSENADIDVAIFDNSGTQVFFGNLATIIETPLYADGNYYVRLESLSPANTTDTYNLTLTNVGNIVDLGPGETVAIPVWFTPQAAGPLNDILTINNSTATDYQVALSGVGASGNLTIAEIAVPEFSQTGGVIETQTLIRNNGIGSINEHAELAYYFSTDDVLDAGDTPLGTTELPLFAQNGSTVITSELTIPGGLFNAGDTAERDYHIIAVVDEANLILESDDTLADNSGSAEIAVSQYATVVTDSSGIEDDLVIAYGTNAVGGYATQEYVTVTNRGVNDVTLTDWSVANGDYFYTVRSNTPGVSWDDISIAPGGRAEIAVRFTPSGFNNGQDIHNDVLTINTSEGLTYDIQLSGAVVGPALAIVEQSGTANDGLVEFGDIRTGVTSPTTAVTLRNYGNEALTIETFTFGAGVDSPFALVGAPELPIVLEAGQDTELLFNASPDEAQALTDTLAIGSNAFGSHAVELSAQGVTPQLTVTENLGIKDDNHLPFGFQSANADTPATATVSLSNTGTFPLTITGWACDSSVFQVTGPAGDDILVGVGETVDLSVAFTATQQGMFRGNLTVNSNDGDRVITIDGQTAVPSFNTRDDNGEVTAIDAIDLGQTELGIGSSSEWFMITNTGLVDLSLYSIGVQGTGFSISHDDMQALAPGQTLRVEATFAPGVDTPLGAHAGTIVIDTSAADDIRVDLSGVAVTPEIDLSTNSVDFGAVDVGETAGSAVVISNTGTSDLIIDRWESSNPQIALDIAGPLVVAPGNSETVNLNYSPIESGNHFGRVTLFTNDLDEPAPTVDFIAESSGMAFPIEAGQTYGFHDASGDLVRVSLNEGSARMYLQNGLRTGADIAWMELNDVTGNARLSITLNGGATSVGQLNVNGSVNSINAPDVTINQGIDVDGSLASLSLEDVADDAVIRVRQSAGRGTTRVTVGDIGENVIFDLADPTNFRADSYAGGELTAPEVTMLNISRGSLGANVTAFAGGIGNTMVSRNITGTLQALLDVGMVNSRGAITGGIISQTGSVQTVIASKDITAQVLALENIGILLTPSGNFGGTARAQNLTALLAEDLNGGIVSVADRISIVSISDDVIDAHVLAGYDIGMDGLPGADDEITGGDIGAFLIGDQLINSHVAIGVAPIYSTLIPAQSGPSSSGEESRGLVFGGRVVTDNDGQLFGFYYDEDVSSLRTNALPGGDFTITNVTV